MPKMKTHKGAAKRFKVTGTGKIMRTKHMKSHFRRPQESKREMPRVKRGFTRHRRHAKILKAASGFRATRSRLFRFANQIVMRSRAYQYRDRRTRKRDMR